MKYIAIDSRDIGELIKKVNNYITNGWKLIGGICLGVRSYDSLSYYLQAMIKEE